ncbi:hypothetical protein BO82DRAFT_302115 [Aspergillus uvarum CBS 121591]|uniref:Uncharacterized protein n=1 Tax=Aspergillus uvarum CBS 121591 TaxID=1448315 RepID=A0A319D3P4_9EURO|nr:hypothetical protein BO82DRAFT_302115 [Aspergillus uvarum CBS 121591]PYH85653.1 hypothetical protein BO82DRAFT_302115 [Aspergillus uvarum CBS 121591]
MAPPRSSGGSRLSKVLSTLNPRTWMRRLDLDTRSSLMMLKGALPPTIVIAIYQSSSIADITLTIGYLSALISVLSQALMPRAKFMKIMFFDLLSTCVSASLCCLAIFCAVKAREHNTPKDASESVRTGFSSDACAVSAIWLIFMIWGANTIRAWKPMELQDPMVAFSIFCSVTITRAGTFVTLSDGLSFVSRLLKGFMLGFAIAIGVSLFILPITSRGHVFEDIKGYVAQIDAVLRAHIEFVGESPDMWTGNQSLLSRTRTARSVAEAGNNGVSNLEAKKKALGAAVTKLNALHGKLQSDMFYSKDEIAWGKLSADDLSSIGGLLRSLLLPLSGMAMLPDILEMVVKNEGTRNNSVGSCENGEEAPTKQAELQKVAETLHKRLVESAHLVKIGLQYVLLRLELKKRKHLERLYQEKDEEATGEMPNPLQQGFTALLQREINKYYSRRKDLARTLASLEAFSLSENADYASSNNDQRAVAADPDVKQEFFMILYMGHLQDNILKATLDLVKFADNKIDDGTMKRNRLIFPKQKTILQWLSPDSEQKESGEGSGRRQSSHVNPSAVYEEREAETFPDPEHLPPANFFEKGSIVLRVISKVIKSEQSIFGFRVAAAAFCVGILAFLRQTQDFFIHQRCIWAMIVIVIGMNPTSGQTMFGFVARIAGTVVSMVLSLIVWYIVDGKTAGVIVFLYIGNIFEYYFYIKVPQYFGATVIAIVTFNVIVGYELQVRKLGVEVATSNGQPYYPIYIFGPYKLAAVAAGCAISFFWVIFPYPITAKSTLRKALGRGLFVLAKFYSCMHTTIELWLNGELGSLHDDVRSASHHLDYTRHKIFKEEMILLNSLRMHSHFSSFEPPIGGKFPKPTYDRIIGQIQRTLTSMALMAHTTQNLDAFSADPPGGGNHPQNKWVARLASIALQSAGFKSHQTTSLLCHLSASMTNAQPLPPYLSTGDSFPLVRELQRIDGELLSIRHVEDPAFSAFVCLEVLRSVVSFTLDDLLRDVRSLVGELSFDFHVRHAQDNAESQRLMSEVDA